MSKELILKLRYIALCADRADVREAVGQAADALEAKAAPVGEPDDDRAAIHQLAFELGGTEGGEYLLDIDDLNAVIDAAHQRQQVEYGDAYQGAREDLAIWKRRALEAEARVRQQDQIIDQMGEDLNAINGPTFMGEPVLPRRQAREVVMPDDLEELLTEVVDIHRRRGVVLTIHIEQIADILARLNDKEVM